MQRSKTYRSRFDTRTIPSLWALTFGAITDMETHTYNFQYYDGCIATLTLCILMLVVTHEKEGIPCITAEVPGYSMSSLALMIELYKYTASGDY
jgi:hypothetical protein